jgi:hypothetical protein
MEFYSDVFYIEVQCKECGEYYKRKEWCKLCQIKRFNIVLNWSENEKINDFVQEMLYMRLDYYNYYGHVFEWIPYNHLNCAKEIERGAFTTVYSAIWNDGPLKYDKNKKEWKRISDYKVALKSLHGLYNGLIEV